MNETIEFLLNRKTVRNFNDQPVTNEELSAIKACIKRSPSAGNMQDYSVIIVQDEVKREALSILCDNQPLIKKAPVSLIFLADYSRYARFYRLNNVDMKDFPVPHYGSLNNAMIDATIAAQTASIACESLGIGNCYIGDIVAHVEEITSLLNIPPFTIPVAMLSIGHYDSVPSLVKPRIDDNFLFHVDEYLIPSDEEINGIYEASRVPGGYKDKVENFADFHYQYKTGASFSKDMNIGFQEYIQRFFNSDNEE